MNVLHTRTSISAAVDKLKADGKTIGFVPTMGALHEGHLALVKRAIEQSDEVIVSIFVNPTQFNNPADLEKYPRMLEKDVELLESVGEVIVFAPVFEEVYPENDVYSPIDLGGLDLVLEGKFRPGHFQGVVHVVKNLFDIVRPDKAFFGLKDFQQLTIIKRMVEVMKLPVQIVPCSTTREENGLALSSRNLRLNDTEREDALIIYRTLRFVVELRKDNTPAEARQKAIDYFNNGNLKLEYLEIIDSESLKTLDVQWSGNATCCIAAFCGEVRLIDNIQL
jgi:pantoate--beta-alanine ligase